MAFDYDAGEREVDMNSHPIGLKAYENAEFLNSPEARTLRILSEYIEPKSRLDRLKVNTTVLFLGSARIDPEDKRSRLHRYYWEAEELAFRMARWAIPLRPKGKNFVICTGAGPGIMEAANRGAARAGGKTIGMNIALPQEQAPNPYISPELSFAFHYFFMRKFFLISQAKAVIAFPGGYGTLDEFFETMTLIQTGKIDRREVVVVLYGEDYWRKVIDFKALIKAGTIAPEDVGLFKMFSDPQKAFLYLKRRLTRLCGCEDGDCDRNAFR
ncbi:MAG: LOG family protein [Candidatus Aminicenantes bacterium]|nr:LOG family protein [Candidatus Aminicenantes bacterium]